MKLIAEQTEDLSVVLESIGNKVDDKYYYIPGWWKKQDDGSFLFHHMNNLPKELLDKINELKLKKNEYRHINDRKGI